MNQSTTIRVLVAGHQTILRDALARLLESEPGIAVIAQASDANETIDLVRQRRPDVLLLELAMPGDGSIEVLKRLSLLGLEDSVRTIVLTTRCEKEAVATALRFGVSGVVVKEAATSLLFRSIRKVARKPCRAMHCDTGGHNGLGDARVTRPRAMGGQSDLGRTMTPIPLMDPPPARTAPSQNNRFRLTRREMDIVAAVSAGESNKGIAERLSLSEDTVKHHVSNVFDKLGVFSRLELAVFAINHQLVKESEYAS